MINKPLGYSDTGIYFVIIESVDKDEKMGLITKLFTNSRVMHCGFVDLNTYELIDMLKGLRITSWPRYPAPKYKTRLYPADKITRQGLNTLIRNNDEPDYGYMDYITFAFRWLFTLFGSDVPDFEGRICSELVAEWANEFGYDFPTKTVAAPVDIENHIVNVLKLPALT